MNKVCALSIAKKAVQNSGKKKRTKASLNSAAHEELLENKTLTCSIYH